MTSPPHAEPTETSWRAWRKAERARLLAERAAMPLATRRRLAPRVAAHLDTVVRESPCAVLGLYWPIKHEIDLRAWAGALATDLGLELAMPAITLPHSPLVYWRWHPGAAMMRGFWNIPVPVEQVPVDPDLVLAPIVGFHGCWRLGYGGGYFDRTLAARSPRPRAIGIGLDFAELAGFVPQRHDIALDAIVTESRILRRGH